ncbi:RNA polymerase sigma factor, sigma-70 family [Sebaldella termitidis]|uniref:RNA polymerase sigma-70 region 4 domain-containing protein n=1 Tax=Sebaldella termitidis (strain ATCC 33386 / NCTC 11300) TaxID=526218 RepID=D1AHQ1_SEBTE|nr:hypothetical protein [Sebaldella termitidis]ACZ08285.1 hypothetical protein Sterm_1423 [Sebaldella termitidis ATCC 33386]SUI23595.1 RNA polymerase sigma factor, sigma-70 family [Sebaldella termitidis]
MAKSNKELIKEVIEELGKMNVLKVELLNPYQKMEKLLYMYTGLKLSIDRKKNQLEDLEKNGIIPLIMGISERVDGGIIDHKSEVEKQEDRKEKLKNEIDYFEKTMELIENTLETVKQDKYYRIIELKYFNKKNLNEIAEEFQVDISTIKRNKNRLINEIVHIFITEKELKKLTEI